MRLILSAALLIASSAVAAEDPSASGITVKDVSSNAHLAAAVRLYQKLDLDAALAELQLAQVDATESQDAPGRSGDRRAPRRAAGRGAPRPAPPPARLRRLQGGVHPGRAGARADPGGAAGRLVSGRGYPIRPSARLARDGAQPVSRAVLRH